MYQLNVQVSLRDDALKNVLITVVNLFIILTNTFNKTLFKLSFFII